MISGALGFYTVASQVLDAVNALLAATPDGSPLRACVTTGMEPAWDDCECGQLLVSITRSYPSETFPVEQTVVLGGCDASYAVAELLVQVLRCAPQPAERALAPTCAALDESAQTVERDAYAAMRGTACTLADLQSDDEIEGYLIRSQERIGPLGACVGSELHVVIGLAR